jgi:hypothetical protein
MPLLEVHSRYPVSNLIPESSLPLLPSGPFPTAQYEYRQGRTFALHSLAASTTLRNLPLTLSIGGAIEVGFGLYRQRVRCSTHAFLNAEARIYDPLQVDVSDLPFIEGNLHVARSLRLAVPQERPPSKEAVSQQHFPPNDDTSTLATSQKTSWGDDSSPLHNLSQSLEGVQISSNKTPTMLPPPAFSSTSQTPTPQGEYTNSPSHKSEPADVDDVTQDSEDLLAGIRKLLDEEGIVSSPHLILFSHPNLTL